MSVSQSRNLTLMPVDELWMEDVANAYVSGQNKGYYKLLFVALKAQLQRFMDENKDGDIEHEKQQMDRYNELEHTIMSSKLFDRDSSAFFVDHARRAYQDARDAWKSFSKDSFVGYHMVDELYNHRLDLDQIQNRSWVIGYRYNVAKFVRSACAVVHKLQIALDFMQVHSLQKRYASCQGEHSSGEEKVRLNFLDGSVDREKKRYGVPASGEYPEFSLENLRWLHDTEELTHLIAALTCDIATATMLCSQEDQETFVDLLECPMTLQLFFCRLQAPVIPEF